MQFVFFGTPEFAAAILEKLIKSGWSPALVICNLDRPVGRKKIITAPPTKIIAQKYEIPVAQPENLKNSDCLSIKADFALVAAYSQIISKEILEMFKLGVIGVHPSLLPKYRGASPIQSVILNGELETGVTLYLMDEKVDHGSILAKSKLLIADSDGYEELLKKLADLAADLLIKTLPKFLDGKIISVVQDENLAVGTKKFRTEDGFVDLEKDEIAAIERKIRALNPEPGVWTFQKINGVKKRVKLLKAKLVKGKLIITKIQVEGKKEQESHLAVNNEK